jgi:hypothetical protein
LRVERFDSEVGGSKPGCLMVCLFGHKCNVFLLLFLLPARRKAHYLVIKLFTSQNLFRAEKGEECNEREEEREGNRISTTATRAKGERMTQENDEKYIFKRKMRGGGRNGKEKRKSQQKIKFSRRVEGREKREKSNDPIYLNLHPLEWSETHTCISSMHSNKHQHCVLLVECGEEGKYVLAHKFTFTTL